MAGFFESIKEFGSKAFEKGKELSEKAIEEAKKTAEAHRIGREVMKEVDKLPEKKQEEFYKCVGTGSKVSDCLRIETPTQVSREDFLKFVEDNKEELKGKLCVI